MARQDSVYRGYRSGMRRETRSELVVRRAPAQFAAYDRMESRLLEADRARLARLARLSQGGRQGPGIRFRIGAILVRLAGAIARERLMTLLEPSGAAAAPCPEE